MKRTTLIVLLCLVMLAPLGPYSDPARIAKAGGSSAQSLDERATALRERLGRFCRNFDFYFRHSFGNGEMRPVRCSRAGREKTVLVAYVFSNRRTKDAWVSEWGTLAKQRNEPVFKGRRWTVEVLQHRWAEEIRAALSD
jgi:hypothetical protein